MATLPTRSAKAEGPRISACVAAARALDAALSAELKPIPDGWFSRQMFQESEGVTKSTAKDRIQQMTRRGLLEKQNWRTATGTTPIYRVKS